MLAPSGIPDKLWGQFESRCEALGKTPVEALRNWLDSNPPPTPAPERQPHCLMCADTGYVPIGISSITPCSCFKGRTRPQGRIDE